MGVSGHLRAPAALPPVKAPVPMGWEAGWAPESSWIIWRREGSLASAGNRNPVVQPVAPRCAD
jgi:hypothetical protein